MKSKSRLVRAFFVLGVLLAVALIASPVIGASEKPMTIKNMKVSVWPEYDDPRVLVIYQGEFNDGTSFPKSVKFPAPMGSEINQVCALKQPGDEHLCQLYDTLTEQDNLGISYTLPIPTYFLEYYWDGIRGQPDKSFTFKYVSPYAVDKLELEIQQPLKATDFKLAQTYASVNSDNQGMKYYHYIFNNVTPGQVISVDATYTKPDNKPSVAKKQGSASGAGAAGANPYMMLAIGGALVVLIVGFMAFKRKPAPAVARATQSNRQASKVQSVRHTETQQASRQDFQRQSRQQSKAGPASRQGTGVSAFCSKCGAKLQAGDNFCHVCGEKTRRSS